MLELRDIHYHPATLTKAVLAGVSLKASNGTPTVISGASGSGKTSLIEIISGLSSPKKGSIYVHGKNLNTRQRRSISGVVFSVP